MLVVNRFRVPVVESAEFRVALEAAHALLAAQKGYVGGHIGRNVDDPELWVLQTRWEGAGAYRRGLGAYDVRLNAWEVLGRAIEEPSAYETVEPGQPVNESQPRG